MALRVRAGRLLRSMSMVTAVGDKEVVVAALAGSMAGGVGERRGGAKRREADNTSGATAERKGRVNEENGWIPSDNDPSVSSGCCAA